VRHKLAPHLCQYRSFSDFVNRVILHAFFLLPPCFYKRKTSSRGLRTPHRAECLFSRLFFHTVSFVLLSLHRPALVTMPMSASPRINELLFRFSLLSSVPYRSSVFVFSPSPCFGSNQCSRTAVPHFFPRFRHVSYLLG